MFDHSPLCVGSSPVSSQRFALLTSHPIHVRECLSLTRAIHFLSPVLLLSPEPLVTRGVKDRMKHGLYCVSLACSELFLHVEKKVSRFTAYGILNTS